MRCWCGFCDVVLPDGEGLDGYCDFCFAHCPDLGAQGNFERSLAGLLRWRTHQTKLALEKAHLDPILWWPRACVPDGHLVVLAHLEDLADWTQREREGLDFEFDRLCTRDAA